MRILSGKDISIIGAVLLLTLVQIQAASLVRIARDTDVVDPSDDVPEPTDPEDSPSPSPPAEEGDPQEAELHENDDTKSDESGSNEDKNDESGTNEDKNDESGTNEDKNDESGTKEDESEDTSGGSDSDSDSNDDTDESNDNSESSDDTDLDENNGSSGVISNIPIMGPIIYKFIGYIGWFISNLSSIPSKLLNTIMPSDETSSECTETGAYTANENSSMVVRMIVTVINLIPDMILPALAKSAILFALNNVVSPMINLVI